MSVTYNMTNQLLKKVWQRGAVVEGCDPNLIRKDCCGALLLYHSYNDHNSNFGWGVDHILPVSAGGDDNPINLRPMHWKNLQYKGDSYPDYEFAVTAEGNENVERAGVRTVNVSIQEDLKKTLRHRHIEL